MSTIIDCLAVYHFEINDKSVCGEDNPEEMSFFSMEDSWEGSCTEEDDLYTLTINTGAAPEWASVKLCMPRRQVEKLSYYLNCCLSKENPRPACLGVDA